MTKFILPAKLISMKFVYNGEMGEPRYCDPRPKGKVHIQHGTADGTQRRARCGHTFYHEWNWYVRVEDICRTCLTNAFIFYPKEIEL